MKVKRYKLVTADNVSDGIGQFQTEINELIGGGWQPLGAPFVLEPASTPDNYPLLGQALVLCELRIAEQTGGK